jgi:hypothetical protein
MGGVQCHTLQNEGGLPRGFPESLWGTKQYTHVHLLHQLNHLNISACIASATKRVLLTSKSGSMPNHKLLLVRSPLHM